MKPLLRALAADALPIAAAMLQARRGPFTATGSYDALGHRQRQALVGVIVVAHLAALWALLQVHEVREAVAQVAPIFAALVVPDKPPEPIPPPTPPSPPQRRVAVERIVAAPPSPAPAPVVVVAPAAVTEPVLADVAVAAPPEPAPAPPAPAPAPRVIPASAVQYLEPLALDYPRLSKRLGETGRVVVRVFIDEGGLARNARVDRSSGYARLDEAATAAVQKARFKPYTENARAVAGWAFIPIDFELEK